MNDITKHKISERVKTSPYFIQLKIQKIECEKIYYQHPKICPECNGILKFEKRKNKFCSSKCAGGYNTRGRIHSEQTKMKISKSNKGNIPWNLNADSRIDIECPICHTYFKTFKTHPGIFCSRKCLYIDQKNGYNFAKNPHSGGYRRGSGRGKSGWYKGYWCDSSYELAYVIFNLEHKISFIRNSESFSYQFENQTLKYYPDFIQNSIYIETKGFLTDKDQAKFKYFPKNKQLILITGNDINKYLDYSIAKYGTDFIKLYEGNPHNKRNNKCLICGKPAIIKYCSRRCAGISRNIRVYPDGVSNPESQQ